MLSSVEIRHFRTFSHLVIERLGQINLIVGKNNVGKTCLLEALRLYDAAGAPHVIESLLLARNEVRIDRERECATPMLDMLFHKSPQLGAQSTFGIGPYERSDNEGEWLFISMHDIRRVPTDGPVPKSGEAVCAESISINFRDETIGIRCDEFLSRKDSSRPTLKDPPFIPAAPLSEDVVGRWWDAIVLTELKDEVIEALQLIDPSVLDVAFATHPLDPYRRVAMVRTSCIAGPFPLRSLGDGVVRIFNLAVALQYCGVNPLLGYAGRILLIDEIENGIHHSAHSTLWRMLFGLARTNDVQIVATTHSLDCLRGFAEAVTEDDENDGVAIRLEKVEGEEQTGAVIIDREGLPIVVRDSIEVR